MANEKGNIVHDTRGRKIVSADKVKRELLSSYLLCLILMSMLRSFVNAFIDLDFDMDNYLKPTLVHGILDLIMFALVWSATFSFSINKYSIRKVEMMIFKSAMVMVNIGICVYICVSILYNVKTTYSDLENEYNTLKSTYSSYSKIYDEVDEILSSVDELLEQFKDALYTIAFVKIALSICGNFIGWTLVRKDIERLGIEEDEYNMCMNIDDSNVTDINVI